MTIRHLDHLAVSRQTPIPVLLFQVVARQPFNPYARMTSGQLPRLSFPLHPPTRGIKRQTTICMPFDQTRGHRPGKWIRLCDKLTKPKVYRNPVDRCMDEGRRLVRTEGIHDDGEDYTAFMFQVREAGKEASNVFDLSCRLADIMCSSLCVTVFVGVSMAIPLTMFSIGVKHWEDCPKDARVPVYLIVGGCCGLVKLIATLWRNVQTRRHQRLIDEPDVEGAFTNQTFRTMDTLLLLFLIGWQVAGTIWTFNIWRPRFEPLLHEPSNWCDRTVYMFAVYQLSSTYAATFVFMFILFY
ncbi:transmembrane protein 272-like [Mya arenaria]|uniref:transmembrane protein 272-like n=1 Tax=Mya arenaria TaxID=6604 RepID=UPI0022E1D9FA|nr:transmembrane protein 272-like [Mya arenaria]